MTGYLLTPVPGARRAEAPAPAPRRQVRIPAQALRSTTSAASALSTTARAAVVFPPIVLELRSHARYGPDGPLSRREREVLAHMRGGASTNAIAKALVLSPKTVKSHKMRIAKALGSNGEAAHSVAIAYARRVVRPQRDARPPVWWPLPLREQQIIDLVIRGLSNTEAGHVLHLSEDTVKTYLRRLYKRIGAKSRVHAVEILLGHGLLTVTLAPGAPR